ncbi:hypothetical protein [Aquimarina sediminis]|uniref:hypothetical protein n=1 Tax=Aquimarina sediminis TaxID=2070536 RepID=UPI000CA060EB|nr:hypothetical protein [Aquimarina sediminis]
MGHHIEALITRQKPDKEKLLYLDIPLFTEGEFNIIPLDICHTIYWGKKWNVYDEYGEHFGGVNLICIQTIERIAKELGISDFTIIGTDYHGGIGNQAAIVYKKSKQAKIIGTQLDNKFGLKGVDINSALRAIGVTKQKGIDEFDTINLSNYRNFDSLYEKYEKYCDD